MSASSERIHDSADKMLAVEPMLRSGSRCVMITRASGYSASRVSSTAMCEGAFNIQRSRLKRCCSSFNTLR